jgi:hypothetical protein
MYIRIQGKQVQCVRSPYDPAKKKCVQKVIVTFPRSYGSYKATAAAQLPPEKLALLEAQEVAQLDAWLSKVNAAESASSDQYLVEYGGGRLVAMADAIDRNGIDQSKAAKMWAGIEALSKSLKKAGFPHSGFKATKPKAAPDLPGQQDLLSPAGDSDASIKTITWPDGGLLNINDEQDEADITKGTYAFPNGHSGTFVWLGSPKELKAAAMRDPGRAGWVEFNNKDLGNRWLPENGASAS